MHEDFLGKVCLLSWKGFGLANPENCTDNVARANHVYVECDLPFIVAAQSVETPEGEEHFELCVLYSQDQVKRFLDGPYPPHNRLNVISGEKLFGQELSKFLSGTKVFRVLKKAVVTEADSISTLTSLRYGLVLEGSGKEITIYADDVVPMAICVTSNEIP
jgi:hypothetical protein